MDRIFNVPDQETPSKVTGFAASHAIMYLDDLMKPKEVKLWLVNLRTSNPILHRITVVNPNYFESALRIKKGDHITTVGECNVSYSVHNSLAGSRPLTVVEACDVEITRRDKDAEDNINDMLSRIRIKGSTLAELDLDELE